MVSNRNKYLILSVLFAGCASLGSLGLSSSKEMRLQMGDLHASLAKTQGFEDPLQKEPVLYTVTGNAKYDTVFKDSAVLRAGQMVGLAWSEAAQKRAAEGSSVEQYGNVAEMLLYFNESRQHAERLTGQLTNLSQGLSADLATDPKLSESGPAGIDRATAQIQKFSTDLPATIEALNKVHSGK